MHANEIGILWNWFLECVSTKECFSELSENSLFQSPMELSAEAQGDLSIVVQGTLWKSLSCSQGDFAFWIIWMAFWVW